MCADSSKVMYTVARMHTWARARIYIRSICRAFVYMLSRSPFEYNSPLWHRWRELSKQLSRPLLWLRSARRAVGWREQLKESQSALALRPVSIMERQSVAERHSSDHQTARLRKAAWPETATRSTFLTEAASFSPAVLSNNMIFMVYYSDSVVVTVNLEITYFCVPLQVS